jgi:hypothetical protein
MAETLGDRSAPRTTRRAGSAVESLPLLQPAWQEAAAQNGSKKPRPVRTTASWVGSSWNPLNTKVVARDGPSPATQGSPPIVSLPCPFLSVEEI